MEASDLVVADFTPEDISALLSTWNRLSWWTLLNLKVSTFGLRILITNLSLNVSAHFLLLRDFRANALILDRLLAHCAANFSAFFLGDWSADFFWNLLGYSATHLLARSLALLLGDLLALLPLDLLAVFLLVRHLLVEALSLGDGSALGGNDLLWQLHLLLPRHQLALLRQLNAFWIEVAIGCTVNCRASAIIYRVLEFLVIFN